MNRLTREDGTISRDAERELIERARAGDRAAFECLVRMHYRALAGLAFHLVGNHEDAEDLAQECFVRAYRSLALFRAGGGLRAWLRRILVHLARDRFRARGARPTREAVDVDALRAREPEPAATLGLRESARLVDAAVERLPESQRIAFLLRTREGLAYDQIADATGVTPGTARTQVQRARRTLAERLGRVLDLRRVRRPRPDGEGETR